MFNSAFFTLLLMTSPFNPNRNTDNQTNTELANPVVSETTAIKKMAAYNTWANQQLANWLLKADSAQWHQTIESSFPTLEQTLRHLWNAEHGWLQTLNNQPWSQAIAPDQQLPPADLIQGFLHTSLQFQNFVTTLDEARLQSTRNLGKNEQPINCLGIIQHVFNHATYHRGQLITMGRQVGLDNPPRTDYIFFLMQQ